MPDHRSASPRSCGRAMRQARLATAESSSRPFHQQKCVETCTGCRWMSSDMSGARTARTAPDNLPWVKFRSLGHNRRPHWRPAALAPSSLRAGRGQHRADNSVQDDGHLEHRSSLIDANRMKELHYNLSTAAGRRITDVTLREFQRATRSDSPPRRSPQREEDMARLSDAGRRQPLGVDVACRAGRQQDRQPRCELV